MCFYKLVLLCYIKGSYMLSNLIQFINLFLPKPSWKKNAYDTKKRCTVMIHSLIAPKCL